MPSRNDAATTEALHQLLAATVALTHRATAVAQQLHGQGETTAGRRGVLLSLQRLGPLTVPQLARMRPVSRQHIQVLVNALLQDGLVELTDNPAHQRSHLVRITEAGAILLAQMRTREDHVFQRLPLPADARQLQATADLLGCLGELMAGPAFARLAKRPPSPKRSRS